MKRGEPVEPVTIDLSSFEELVDIELLGVRADFARIEPIGDGDNSPTLQALAERPEATPELFYLGRSSATVLRYGSRSQRSEQVPSDSA